METARDLACAELWQASLERSLARRGRPTRSSLELHHLVPARDLARAEFARESAQYSRLRRSAAARRPSMALPGAGGISALALLAAATMPGLLGGRGGTRAGHERVVLKTSIAAARIPGSAVVRRAVKRAAPTSATTATGAVHMSSIHVSDPPTTQGHVAVAHRASTSRDVAGGTAHAASGGAVAASPKTTAAAPRVPVNSPQPHGHPSTGGRAVQERSAVVKPGVRHHPVATTRPAAIAKPAPTSKPAPAPTTTAAPAPTAKPAPAAPAVAPGHYANPLAGANVTPERIDQGVDYAGSGPLGAVGAGRVTYLATEGTGWPGAFIEYQLTDGAYAGWYVYYAEGVTPAPGLHVGETLQAGQPVASIVPESSSGIEIGWGAGVGTETLAMQLGQWTSADDANSVPSASGESFSNLIESLGGLPGKIEG